MFKPADGMPGWVEYRDAYAEESTFERVTNFVRVFKRNKSETAVLSRDTESTHLIKLPIEYVLRTIKEASDG